MNLAHPGWLALLILIPLLGIGAVLTSRLRQRQWTAFMAPRLRGSLLKRGSSLPRWLSLFFLLAACAALIIALARPRGDAGTRTEKTLGRNVMIALDISKSMRVKDVHPDRLGQAKVVIYELLEAMPNERIGFIGFAGTPYVYAPLTIDHGAVRETVEQIDETWAPLGGSDLAAAVQLATETLKKTGQKNNALVILSDGEENDGHVESMIAEAEQSGVYIITIGVGTEDGDHVPNADFPGGNMVDRAGHPVISRLQTDALRKLAEDTKGRFAMAGSGLDIPALVKSVVKDLDAFEMEGRERRISIEFYQWLAFPAILLLLASIISGTRWKGARAAVLLGGAFLTLTDADASEATNARDALAAKRYPQAREAYHKLAAESKSRETQARYRLGEATAAYRAGDFREARGAFSGALLSEDPKVRANGHLGMGNSLFQLGWKSLAGEAYPAAPAELPDLAQFDALVGKALAKLRESEPAAEGDAAGYANIESMITNWADSVKHYNSTLAQAPADPVARKNREMTMTYLKRLEELLNEEKQAAEQAMPQPGEGEPGEGEPQEGDGDQEGDKDGKGKKDGDKDGGDKDPKDGKGENGDKDKDGKNGKGKDPKDGEEKDGENPNESPQERAHRLLKENADPEKGPLTPGRREFRNAEKDW